MYIFTNAIENIVRNKGRNILMGAIIFAIIATTVVALIINNTANTVISSYKDRFSSEVSITPDMSGLREQMRGGGEGGRIMTNMFMSAPLETELLLQFADSEYLKETIAYATVGVNSSDDSIRAIDQQDNDNTEESLDTNVYSRGNIQGVATFVASAISNYRIYGDYWQDFTDGYRTLDSGNMPQADNECVISSDLAELNNISIGDILTLTADISISYDNESAEYSEFEEGDVIILNGTEYTVVESFAGGRATRKGVYQLEVVGIYLDLTDEYSNEFMPSMAFLNRRNEILTTFDTVVRERKQDEQNIQVDTKYYLRSPDMLDAFEAEVRAKGLPDTYAVSVDIASYERIVRPVEGLRSISIAFMLIVLILGGVILILLSTMAIRERKYEIGVLRAMGMKKSKVALGLWTEMIALTCVCLIIGLSVGSIAAQPVTDSLLQMQIEAEEQNNRDIMGGNGMRGGPIIMGGARIAGGLTGIGADVQPLSEMKINMGFNTVIQIIIISLILASAAGLASIAKITKYEPIKILMERN